jgi:transposase InsO family protein
VAELNVLSVGDGNTIRVRKPKGANKTTVRLVCIDAPETSQYIEGCDRQTYSHLYIGSERSFYRVLHANSQLHRRGRTRLPQEARQVPRLKAKGPNQVWSWDISYLPTSVKGIWLYLYLVVDIWSRKVVAWDVEQSESAELAAQLVSRACLKERIINARSNPGGALRRAGCAQILL